MSNPCALERSQWEKEVIAGIDKAAAGHEEVFLWALASARASLRWVARVWVGWR